MFKRINVFFVIGFLFLLSAAALSGYNFYSDYAVGKKAENILSKIDIGENDIVDSNEVYVPDYIIDPDMDMPTETIDGNKYVGVLEIPALSLKLPVISSWSYGNLSEAPCVYYGSAYKNNMVIAAHNYAKHFGRLKELVPGDSVVFTDIDGNRFNYVVSEIQILQPLDVKEMTESDADLTLFTCTIGGSTRVTVRCCNDNEK